MKNLKKTLAMISAVLMAGSVFAACGGSSTTSETTPAANGGADTTAAADGGADTVADGGAAETPAEGGEAASGGSTLTVMTWNTEFLEMVENYYLKDHPLPDGVTWNPVTFGVGGGEVSSYYDNYFASGEDADLFCLEADWAMNYLDKDDITAPLSSVGIDESELAAQYDYTKAIGKSSNGTLKGITWQAAPGGFAYRADLAEKYLDAKSVDEVQAKLNNWDNFLAAAKTLQENGVAICPTLGGVWQVFSSSRSQPWVVDNKLVVTDEVSQFMNLANQLVQNKYTLNYDQWTPEWYAAGQTDDVFGYFVSTWGIGDTIIGQAAGGQGGATWGKWALCEGPQAYYWGGTWLATSPKTDNADLVADIMRYFCVNEDSMKSYALASGDFLNNKSVMQSIVDEGINSNENLGGQDQFAIWLKNADGINLSFMSAYDKDVKSALETAYKAYAAGEQDYDTAINTFKDGVATSLPSVIVE
ncbi:MAG: carbohydrate ABC transporter substrate-binding protein [Huintestinicola sp.]